MDAFLTMLEHISHHTLNFREFKFDYYIWIESESSSQVWFK